jgi:hypothetical protein
LKGADYLVEQRNESLAFPAPDTVPHIYLNDLQVLCLQPAACQLLMRACSVI